ncbi:ubiquitin carboxyl-terminal hydrolase 15 [Tetranychus urticae]|uniref:ubiquitin carboxyl-terminal hydrolase 15 n=1 Tax=Tetranychus urticae TaxID=32264 RepID=UPI00077BE7DC|nr:ubiquitin carboxyl-terminal hydrolase 15 [Tetranychus urticae]
MTKEVEMEVDDNDKVAALKFASEVDKMVNRELKEGEFWYVLDNKWFQTYKQYLQACDDDMVNNPGPIDNSDLFKTPEGKTLTLKENLVENEDFVYVPAELWTILVNEFGLSGKKHMIRRKVIDRPSARASYKLLELYPVELKLCLHGTKQEIITAQFSQVTTLKELEKEMRKLFKVDDKAETQLWACGSLLNAYDPSEPKKNDDQTLVEASLSSGAIVTLEVQNSDGSWPSSRPRFGAIATRSSKITPGLCGLMNLGNTCFMNSALQCMSNTPPLTEYFVNDKYWDELNVDNPLGMGGEIAKTYGDLNKAMWSGLHSFLSPREFKQAVGKFSPQFSGFQQQDCQELMAFLLDGLHEDLNRVKKKPYIEIKQEIDKRPDSVVAAESWSNYLKRNDSIIVDTFHGLLKSTLVCPECDLVSVTFDPYCYLSLPLPVKRERAIDVMFVPARPLTVGPEKKIKQVIKICKLTVPKVGIVPDICNAAARAINESKEINGFTVNPSNLIVTEVNHYRLTRVYNQDDSFSSNADEIYIFEKLDDCTALPVYIRRVKGEDSAVLFAKPFFVNIKQCTYEALYSAVKNYVETLMDEPGFTKETTTQNNDGDEEMGAGANSDNGDTTSNNQVNHKTPTSTVTSASLSPETASSSVSNTPTNSATEATTSAIAPTATASTAAAASGDEKESPMDDKEDGEVEGEDEPFTLRLINSFGTMPLGKISKDKPLELGSKTFIAADFTKRFRIRSIDNEETMLRMNLQKSTSNVGKSHNLSECIEQFTTTERLGEHDLWYCPRCKKRQQASKKFDIWSLPKVAIFHLKRFSYSKYWRDKLDTFVNFPLYNLDLGQYLINNPKKEKILYNLVAVANHYGGLGGGHYTAYGKNKETGTWYHFDDSNVSQASEDAVVSKAAYVLLYLRQD